MSVTSIVIQSPAAEFGQWRLDEIAIESLGRAAGLLDLIHAKHLHAFPVHFHRDILGLEIGRDVDERKRAQLSIPPAFVTAATVMVRLIGRK